MTRTSPAGPAVKRSNKSAWLAGAALITTFAIARAFDRGAPQADAARPKPAWHAGGLAQWKHILYWTYEEFNDDRLLSLAPGVVFYGLLALFPAITALVSSYALFADPATITGHLATLKSVLPQGAYGIIDQQVTRIASTTTGDLSLAFFGSLAIALWSANSGLKAIIDALNIVYGVKEWRSFIRLNVVSLIMTAGTIVGLLLAMAAVVAVPIVLSYLPLGSWGAAIMAWLRWPALLLLVMLGLALLYRFGPNRDNPRWEFLSPGAVFAAAAWLAGSALLSWYLSNFADYGATYGSLGAAIGLMMWLWMSAIVVLLGA
ncbi:MAG: YihY/virulence factor BrkB family protein, partial [Pseudolabrys sp.]